MSSIIKVDTVQDQDGNNIINENANTITIGASGDTITIPSGATLANNGTATGFASIAWQSSIVTAATLTAVAGNGYWINTTSNACTITLPASASVGDQIIFSDYLRTWGTNAVTINPNSLNFQGNTTPQPVYDTAGESIDIVYSGATQGWIPNNDGAVSLETPQPYTADFLVIAGGAAGGGENAGGGGAGGYRNSYSTETSGGGGSSETGLQLTTGEEYTITVGAGGSGVQNLRGVNGSNSLISGTGITTITSIGGGGGGSGVGFGGIENGNSGGSGGGAADSAQASGTGGSGTANQGYSGGNANASFNYDGGGGGGASAVGANVVSSNVGGNGGAGLASSITGSSVSRAGGGGGGGDTTGGTGGTGGGGNGSISGGDPTNGTTNTGSGGGGERENDSSGSGGSGVVILRMPTASYSGTVTGAETPIVDGSDTILVFNGDGSYTG